MDLASDLDAIDIQVKVDSTSFCMVLKYEVRRDPEIVFPQANLNPS